VIFNAETLGQAGEDLMGMFGLLPVPLVTVESLYYLKSFALLLIAGFVGATPLVRNGAVSLQNRWDGTWVLRIVVGGALLLLCTAYLVDRSFNPFLYFRF
jgi:alginate O-acetyltransferase complex protein AlgI